MIDKFAVFVPRLAPQIESFAPGHRACQGCVEALAVRLVCKALGRDVIISNATGCMEIVSSQMPFTSWRVPWIHTLFENTAAVASGIESGLKALKRKGRIPDKKISVVAMAGDGGTYDIGLQALSGALERGHDFTYICFDNEAYMNTGIQRSSATPFGAMTTTSPVGKVKSGQFTWKKDMPAIVAAHHVPYMATACPSYPFDLMEKVKKAAATPGPSYVHVLSVCPTGWGTASNIGIRLGRLAVETGVFPLYEMVNGQYRITLDVPELRPIDAYLKPQRRFRHLSKESIALIQERVTREYHELKEKSERRS